jgi:hydrogenase/urease accessory protein HupE
MRAPQVIVIAVMSIMALLQAYLHGSPRTGRHNFFTYLISTAATTGILIWGGFFG